MGNKFEEHADDSFVILTSGKCRVDRLAGIGLLGFDISHMRATLLPWVGNLAMENPFRGKS